MSVKVRQRSSCVLVLVGVERLSASDLSMSELQAYLFQKPRRRWLPSGFHLSMRGTATRHS